MARNQFCLFGLVGMLALSSFLTPAFACKGTTTLLRDDFTDVDPAWDLSGNTKIEGGSLKAVTDPGRINWFDYQGQNFPAADACVDIVFSNPPVRAQQAGIGIWNGAFWDFVYIQPDGQAGVSGVQNGAWVHPVPVRKSDAVKTDAGAVNQLRVVWKAPPAQNSPTSPDPFVHIYINDKPFINFKVTPNLDRTVALWVDTEGGTITFKNLNMTQ